MTLPASAIDFAIKAVQWLNPLVYVVGVAIGAWAYRLSRKPGYMVVTVYFLLTLWSVSIAPAINRMMEARRDAQQQSEISPQAHDQFMKEYAALEKKYYPPGHSTPAKININFPFGRIILVSGFWLLARRESRRSTRQDGPTVGSQPFPSE